MRRRQNPFIAFLRSPAQWATILCTGVVILFMQLFGTWNLKPDIFGQMYFFAKLFFWLCVLLGLALSVHFAFDRLTDWLARPEPSQAGERTAPPAAMFRRH